MNASSEKGLDVSDVLTEVKAPQASSLYVSRVAHYRLTTAEGDEGEGGRGTYVIEVGLGRGGALEGLRLASALLRDARIIPLLVLGCIRWMGGR